MKAVDRVTQKQQVIECKLLTDQRQNVEGNSGHVGT